MSARVVVGMSAKTDGSAESVVPGASVMVAPFVACRGDLDTPPVTCGDALVMTMSASLPKARVG
jgi:hypothetical protein